MRAPLLAAFLALPHWASAHHVSLKPRDARLGTAQPPPVPLINVWFHVISADDTPANGDVSLDQILKQVDTLNNAFNRSGLQFVLAGQDKTVNADWFANVGPDTPQQNDMKSSLRRGGIADLNIYTVGFQGQWNGLLGYSTFPQSCESDPTDDGIVVLFSSLPGGPIAKYNLGKTAVHETGHWVGLYHTFQGSCVDPGDFVPDTMPEAIPSTTCTEGRRTCLVSDYLEGETDPIHNYMDYSPDACMDGFTAGQADRMRMQLKFYRRIFYY